MPRSPAMLGTDPKQVMINDLAVNPISGNVYLSVARGRGPDATPGRSSAIDRRRQARRGRRSTTSGSPGPRSPTPPTPAPGEAGSRCGTSRSPTSPMSTAASSSPGLSNEEFSSRLIAIPFPFSRGLRRRRRSRSTTAPTAGSRPSRRSAPSSPTRSSNEPYLLAAYTCTPLVKVPVSELKAGAHVKGTTIAELGNRNRPLDMIVYQKDGKDYLLLANSSRGVMKIPTEGAGARRGHHRSRSRATKGLGYETIAEPQGRRPDGQARRRPRRDPHPGPRTGRSNLETIDLP